MSLYRDKKEQLEKKIRETRASLEKMKKDALKKMKLENRSSLVLSKELVQQCLKLWNLENELLMLRNVSKEVLYYDDIVASLKQNIGIIDSELARIKQDEILGLKFDCADDAEQNPVNFLQNMKKKLQDEVVKCTAKIKELEGRA